MILNDFNSTGIWADEREKLSGIAGSCMDFMAGTLPLSDIGSYPARLFAEFAEHAAMLRETVPWCAGLDEARFLHYVLYPRVNDEDITRHRRLFYGILYPRVADLPPDEAALEANRWCHEIASYQPQDERTASPLAVYRCGVGRCGELSAFLISALRSVGLAARQVYVPRWSHCDDNHAWVEVFCNGSWHFMGACEPEQVLDKGWFNLAASQSILIHSRTFGAPDPHEEAMYREGGVYWYNQTARYADTFDFTVSVTENGAAASGVPLRLELINEAAAWPIANPPAGPDGVFRVKLGMGDFLFSAGHNDFWGDAFRNSYGTGSAAADMASESVPEGWINFDMRCPKASPAKAGNTSAYSASQRQAWEEKLRNGDRLREAREKALFWPLNPEGGADCGDNPGMARLLRQARGNYREIFRFLEPDPSSLRIRLLESLNEKDLRDITAETLEDHLTGAAPYAVLYPDDIYRRCLLCPRIASENISPWRQKLGMAFDSTRRGLFTENPPLLWQALRDEFRIETTRVYKNLFWQPESAFMQKNCDEKSLCVLFVALLRAFGLPARLCPLDGQTPEYWRGDCFVSLRAAGSGGLTLCKQPDEEYRYNQNWSMAMRRDGDWTPVNLSGCDWADGELHVSLPAAEYRLITSNRLPNGNQLASWRRFNVTEGMDERIGMRLRSFRTADLLYKQPLPHCCQYLHKDGRVGLLAWIKPGAEPTDHFLREMDQAMEDFHTLNADIHFLLLPENMAGNTDNITIDENGETLKTLAMSLGFDAQCLPVAVVCDRFGNAVYHSCGYSAGSVRLMKQILKGLEKQGDPGSNPG